MGVRRQIRKRTPVAHLLQGANEDSRSRLRVLGRRLVEVVTQYHAEKRRRPQLLEEARFLGHEYAIETARMGLDCSQAAEAFLYHRTMLSETVRNLTPTDASRDEVFAVLQDAATLTDAVLLALITEYEGRDVGTSREAVSLSGHATA